MQREPINKEKRLSGEWTVTIGYLRDHQETIPLLAEWIFNEWSFLFSEKNSAYVETLLRERLHKDRLPLTLVALDHKKPAGTVSLKDCDMDTRPDLTPWLASLYVDKSWRNRGVGSRLVKVGEKIASELGIEKLFLFTAQADSLLRFYKKLGWKIMETTEYQGYPVVIMEKETATKRQPRGRTPCP